MLLVTKKICKNISQVARLRSNKFLKCCFNSLKKHWNNTSTICLKVILRTRGIVRWGCPNTPFRYGRYIQAVIVFHWFFQQPTQRASLYYFRGICTMISSASFLLSWFAYLPKILCTTFLVPNKFAIAGETAINNGLKFCTKKVYLWIDK